MELNNLSDNKGARKSRMRVGRGIGCGKGKTCGRGVKGQKARTGVAIKGFEGGQMPLFRRLPKRGFKSIAPVDFEVVNLSDIQRAVDAGKLDASKTIDADALKKAGLVKARKDGVKLLGKGTLKAKVTLEVDAASETAQAAVQKAGGKLVLPAAEKAA